MTRLGPHKLVPRLLDLLDPRLDRLKRDHFGLDALKILQDCLRLPAFAKDVAVSSADGAGEEGNHWARMIRLGLGLLAQPVDSETTTSRVIVLFRCP